MSLRKIGKGFLLCLCIAIPCWFLGNLFPVIGAPVFAIISGMLLTLTIKNKTPFQEGIRFVSKKILQYAVILLGFGMNLAIIWKTGRESLPIIICTIVLALAIARAMQKIFNIPAKISTLIGVGSSICGGSAIAATAPVIQANDEEIAQSISVVFFFNVLAALLFPMLGSIIGFSTVSGDSFGIFAGTAVNDTSSVTAVAATWDSVYRLGSDTLDKAVTVKLTRTLAIIPITLILAYIMSKNKQQNGNAFNFSQSFPFFIIYFLLASLVTTIALNRGIPAETFAPLKTLSKFFIVLAMAAIGFNTDIVKLLKTGGKPLMMGLCCWIGITVTSIIMQRLLGL